MRNRMFSVIVLVYNNSEFLKECLDSILEQKYPEIELIVADDGSREFDINMFSSYIEDNSKENIKNYQVYQNEKNLGTVKNINCALSKVHGEYIKIIAADDALYDCDVLDKAQAALDQSPDGIIVSDIILCDPNLVPNGKPDKFDQAKIGRLSAEECFMYLCETNIIDAQGVFMTRAFFDRFGKFDEGYRLLEDWPKWLQVTSKGAKLAYSGFIAAKYRSDCGVGTGINPIYLKDKARAFHEFVEPNKSKLGFFRYLKARLRFFLTTSGTVRRVYAMLVRRK